MVNIRFGIVTVSDTCYADPQRDQSGPKLEEAVKSSFPSSGIAFKKIIPDSKESIQYFLRENSHPGSGCDVILVTGGTGFAPRDVTPEATRSVIDKEAPGLAYAMISKSLEVTEMAMLSRMVCGIRNHTLIINLPGSAKASVECFNFIKNSLPHAVDLMKDHHESVTETHKTVHGSTGYAQPRNSSAVARPSKVKMEVAYRSRKSEWPMLQVENAVSVILATCKRMSVEVEIVDITDSMNRILAEDIVAQDPLPPFPASIKDGYAVLSSDGVGVRKVRDYIAAGDATSSLPLLSGEVIRISTGAAIPHGADAVVQVEDTELVSASSDGTIELEVKINCAPTPGLDIRALGSDIAKGATVLEKGDRITVGHIGVMATVGIAQVKVYKRPRIGIISTGNELQCPNEALKPFHIRDSNKSTLLSLLKHYNFPATDCGIARDEPNSVKEKLTHAFYENDVVITTGGVSMGEFDVIKQVLEADFEAAIYFGRVNMKPGKPCTFATCVVDERPKLVFGLPGNPVSAVVTSTVFVLPALRYLVKDLKLQLTTVRARLEGFKGPLDPRPEYLRVSLEMSKEVDVFIARKTGDQISSRLNSFIGANGLLKLPGRNDPKAAAITKDTVFDVMLLDC